MKKENLITGMVSLFGELSEENDFVIASRAITFDSSPLNDSFYKEADNMCLNICQCLIQAGRAPNNSHYHKRKAVLINNASVALALLFCEAGRRSSEDAIEGSLSYVINDLARRVLIEMTDNHPAARVCACQTYYISLIKMLVAYKNDNRYKFVAKQAHISLAELFDQTEYIPKHASRIEDPLAGSVTNLLSELAGNKQSFITITNALWSISATWKKSSFQAVLSPLQGQIIEGLARAVINHSQPTPAQWLDFATRLAPGKA